MAKEISKDELLRKFNSDIRNRINVLIIKYHRLNLALEAENDEKEIEIDTIRVETEDSDQGDP